MKKILLLRPKVGFHLGGAESHAAEVAVRLIKRGYKVGIIAHKISFPEEYLKELEFYPIKILGFGSILKQLLFISQVKSLLPK
ncbi:MAG: hypothetical protein P3W84_001615, partial [Thermodesulfobacteriaceae bacterium]|nr:hypothetical protein [Thermodesulfobacteriaceae bacterium]